MVSGFTAIGIYRQDQEAHGYDAEHDQHHTKGELIDAALAHLCAAKGVDTTNTRTLWPFRDIPSPAYGEDHRLDNLAKAGAYIAAEYDRLLLANTKELTRG